MNARHKSQGLPKSIKWVLVIATLLTMIGAAASAVVVNSGTVVRAEESSYEPAISRRRVASARVKRTFSMQATSMQAAQPKTSRATSADAYLERSRRLARDL